MDRISFIKQVEYPFIEHNSNRINILTVMMDISIGNVAKLLLIVSSIRSCQSCSCISNIEEKTLFNSACSTIFGGVTFNGHCYFIDAIYAGAIETAIANCQARALVITNINITTRIANFHEENVYINVTRGLVFLKPAWIGLRSTVPGSNLSKDYNWISETSFNSLGQMSWYAAIDAEIPYSFDPYCAAIKDYPPFELSTSKCTGGNSYYSLCEMMCLGDDHACGDCEWPPTNACPPLFTTKSDTSFPMTSTTVLLSVADSSPISSTTANKIETTPLGHASTTVPIKITTSQINSSSSNFETTTFENNTLKTSMIDDASTVTTSLPTTTSNNAFCFNNSGYIYKNSCFINQTSASLITWSTALQTCAGLGNVNNQQTCRLANFQNYPDLAHVFVTLLLNGTKTWIGMRSTCYCTQNYTDYAWYGSQQQLLSITDSTFDIKMNSVKVNPSENCLSVAYWTSIGLYSSDCSLHDWVNHYLCECVDSGTEPMPGIISIGCSTNIKTVTEVPYWCVPTTTTGTKIRTAVTTSTKTTSTASKDTTTTTTNMDTSKSTTTGKHTLTTTLPINVFETTTTNKETTITTTLPINTVDTTTYGKETATTTNENTVFYETTSVHQAVNDLTTVVVNNSSVPMAADTSSVKTLVTTSLKASKGHSITAKYMINNSSNGIKTNKVSGFTTIILNQNSTDSYAQSSATQEHLQPNADSSCLIGHWSEYSSCSETCGLSVIKTRQRTTVKFNSSLSCPIATEVINCGLPPCNPMSPTAQKVAAVMQVLGCSWLILLCTIALVISLFLRSGSIHFILHASEDIALILAHVLIAVFRNETGRITICTWASIGIQYFFIVLFGFIVLEAFEMYTLVTTIVTGTGWFNRGSVMAIGWGVPIPIVAITALSGYKQYASTFSCWLNFTNRVAFGTFVPLVVFCCLAVILVESAGQRANGNLSFENREHVTSAKIIQRSLLIFIPLQVAAWFVGQLAVFYQHIALFSTVFGLNLALGFAVVFSHVISNNEGRNLVTKMWQRVKPNKNNVSPMKQETFLSNTVSYKTG